MAEIKIEKKDRPVWPWILAAIIVIFAAVLLLRDDTRQDAKQVVSGTTSDDRGEVPDEISQYVAYVQGRDGTQEMDLHHEYTSEGIQKLASALDALVDETDTENTEVNDKRDRLKDIADYIQDDSQSLTHADSIRTAFVIASDVIASVIAQNFPELSAESQNVQSSARELSTEKPTLEQRDNVQGFFEDSATALNEISKRWNESRDNQQNN
jgi:hypothetical protein